MNGNPSGPPSRRAEGGSCLAYREHGMVCSLDEGHAGNHVAVPEVIGDCPRCGGRRDEVGLSDCDSPIRHANWDPEERLAEAWDEGHRTPWVLDADARACECHAYSDSECACGNYGATKPATNPYRAAGGVA